MRRLRVLSLLLPLLLPLVLGSGCYVMDELDQSQKAMDRYTPKDKRKPEQAKTAANGEKQPTYRQAVEGWWEHARTLSPSPADSKAGDDPLVSCRHGGRTVFTRRSDCISLGGHAG